jgi:phosphoinositide-3-kinase, regulatory subunit 4
MSKAIFSSIIIFYFIPSLRYDMSIRLDLYSKRVREIKNIIYSRYGMCTNCLPFAEAVITDRAAFLFRQYIRYNLYDRLSTRPFLSLVEKKWLAFQLLCAVNECHSLQIVHGDIKTENVLVNSFLWVSLADFASYKPVYLSKNHPSADFNYYFDISRRRTCYLAPERLDAANTMPNVIKYFYL